MKFGQRYKNDFERIAMVCADRWVEWIAKLSAFFMKGKLASFDLGALQEAVSWARE